MEIHADEFTQTRKLEYNASMSDAEGLTVGGSLLGAINSARYLVVQNQASAFSHRFSFPLYLLIWYGQRWRTLHDSWLLVGLAVLPGVHIGTTPAMLGRCAQ